jgi:hypothetical protein
MEFPITGLIILAVAVWFFFFKPRLLYAAMIASFPFTATAAVNFVVAGGSSLGIGRSPQKNITALELFSTLWVLREVASRTPPWHKSGWFLTRRARFRLLTFLGAFGLSFCVPLIVSGTSWVNSFEAASGSYFVASVPLRLSWYYLTQFTYILFAVTLTLLIAAENWHPEKLLYTLRVYVCSCLFVAGWGMFEFWCIITGHAYPSYIFNTGKNISATGYLQTISVWGLTWGRVASVAAEPSSLAHGLVAALTILLVCLAFRQPILRRGWNWVAIALVTAALTVSTSTTAYVGMFATPILVSITLLRARKRQWKYYAGAAIAAGAAGVAVVKRVPLLSSLAGFLVLHKFSGMNSGATRLDTVKIAEQAFLHYPVLGVGSPVVHSADLVFFILADTGIVGLAAFVFFLQPVFRSLWQSSSRGSLSALLILPLLLWGLVFGEGGGISWVLSTFWFILGIATGAAAAAKIELAARPAAVRGGETRWCPTTGVGRSASSRIVDGLVP